MARVQIFSTSVLLLSLLSQAISVDDSTIIKTYGNSDFNPIQITLTQDFLYFGVEACQAAMLAFSKAPGQTDSDTWVFTLGDEGNTKSKVEKKGGDTQNSFDSQEVLSCDSLRMFWIQFNADSIRFGEGGTIGNRIIGTINTEDTENYNSLSLATGNNGNGNWNLMKDSTHDILISTTNHLDYEQIWMTEYNTDRIVFQVKACSDAHIILAPVALNTLDVYEVAIGVDDNVHSVIRNTRGGTNHVSAWTPDILHCDEFRTFWIKWINGSGIDVGEGADVGVERFMWFRDLIGKPIKAAGFTTGNGATGWWRFVNVGLNSFTIPTTDTWQTHHILVHDEVNYFDFFVRTCSGAVVWLSRDPLPADHPMNGFEVVFGADDNTKIVVKKQPGPTVVAEYIQAEPVSCHAERYFWISWHGILRVGKGRDFTDELIAYEDSTTVIVQTVILSTEYQSGTALWEFSKNFGKGHKIFVDDSKKNTDMSWLDLTGVTEMNIKVSACAGVSMLLASNHGLATNSAYEIIIGDSSSDTPNVIKDGITGTVVASDKTSDVLDCSELRWIWMTWTQDTLHVGHGVDLGGSLLLNWTGIPNRIPINSFGFRGLRDNAVFEFTDVPESLYEVMTPNSFTTPHQSVWISMQRQYFTFEVKACVGAIVALSEIAGNTTWHAYQIRIGISDGISDPRTTIYDAQTGTTVVSVDTPNILDCDDFRQFWVGWTDVGPGRSIHMGSGVMGTKPYIIEYVKLQESAHLRSISLDSVNTADWRFPDDSGISTTFFTPTTYSPLRYMRHLGRSTTQVMNIQACDNANILLYDHHHTDPAYRLVIGYYNQQSYIIKRGFNIAVDHAVTPLILDCDFPRLFWLSWTGGRIAFGYGSIPLYRIILSYEDPTAEAVNYLSFTTDGGSEGQWEFFSLPDNTYFLKTPGGSVTDDFAIRLSSQQTTFGFAVRACGDAVILLRNGGRNSNTLYQINIGVGNNTLTQIADRTGNALVEVTTPDILSCNKDVPFVLTWSQNMIELLQYDQNGRSLISYTEDAGQVFTTEIHGISFYTEHQVEAEWEFPKWEVEAMEYSHFKNTFLANYCCLWLTVQNQYSLTFSVRACSHVSIALTEIPGDVRGRAFEFVLGQGGTPENEIRNAVGGTALVTDNSKDLLSCDFYNTFWIRWYNTGVQQLSIGKGTTPGQSIIMSYENYNVFEIVGLSVSSQEVNSSDWRFGRFVGNKYHVATTKDRIYDAAVVIPKEQWFMFSVQACSGARLLLQGLPFHSQPAYEVVLGAAENTKHEIRNGAGGEILSSVDRDDLLNCDNPVSLWVSWTSGIRVGIGEGNGENQFLTWVDVLKPEVTAISLSSGPEDPAQWEWHFEQDEMVRMRFEQRVNDPADPQWLTISNYRGIVLRIRSCNKVSLIFTEILGNIKVHAYEVMIGDSDNTLSSIHTGVNGIAGVIAHTPGVLSCEDFRTFWIVTEKDTLRVGYGATIYRDEFMEYTGENVHFVQAMALTDSEFSPVEYEFFAIRGNVAKVFTAQNGEYERMVLTPRFNFVTFRVQTCSDAHIALFNEEGSEEKYEIILGKYNRRIEIYRRPDSEWIPDKSVEIWLLFDCNTFRNFWLSWEVDTIRIGYGLQPGDGEVLFFKDPNPIMVRQVGVASGYRFPAMWEFDQDTEDEVHFMTLNDTEDYQYAPTWTVFDKPGIVFQVQACHSAHVAVSTVPGVLTALAFEIIIGSNSNQRIEIKTSLTGEPIISKDVIGLLSCDEMRYFWISWENRELIVGRGEVLGEDYLIGYLHYDSLADITSVSFDTFNENAGRWNFKVMRNEEEQGSGMSAGATAATVIGVLLGVVLLAIIGIIAYQKYSGSPIMLPSPKSALKFPTPSFKASEDKAAIVNNEQMQYDLPPDGTDNPTVAVDRTA